MNPLHFARWLPFLWLGSTLNAQTTFEGNDAFAYSANSGWVNFASSASRGVQVSDTFLSGYAWDGNTGWVSFGNGSPSNGHTYTNTGTDFGVNHDGEGNLSGYAYSANTGWIVFEWTGSNIYKPQIDLLTGDFSGYAYSGNLGWLSFVTGRITTASMALLDDDSDGMADGWEKKVFGNTTTADATTDADADGNTDVNEYIAGTNPNDAADKLDVLTADYNADQTALTVTFTSNPNRHYQIQTIVDLTFPFEDLGNAFVADGGSSTSKTVTFPSSDRRFLQIVAKRPLTQ